MFDSTLSPEARKNIVGWYEALRADVREAPEGTDLVSLMASSLASVHPELPAGDCMAYATAYLTGTDDFVRVMEAPEEAGELVARTIDEALAGLTNEDGTPDEARQGRFLRSLYAAWELSGAMPLVAKTGDELTEDELDALLPAPDSELSGAEQVEDLRASLLDLVADDPVGTACLAAEVEAIGELVQDDDAADGRELAAATVALVRDRADRALLCCATHLEALQGGIEGVDASTDVHVLVAQVNAAVEAARVKEGLATGELDEAAAASRLSRVGAALQVALVQVLRIVFDAAVFLTVCMAIAALFGSPVGGWALLKLMAALAVTVWTDDSNLEVAKTAADALIRFARFAAERVKRAVERARAFAERVVGHTIEIAPTARHTASAWV